ncbi:polysaccharide biosynthesis C-terminal domain-containing protein, partial [Vibrio parahaemolyticus]|uniref:polysaccharide biosynthesis C-terminal domain-containing protein n=1 Tax=Vibrio parahaemolyticus TaxID=670 RepID=UPI0039B50D9F
MVFSFLISWVVYTFSEKIITLAYGIDYTSSIPVLALSCWGFVFISIGAVSSKWLLAEDLQKYSLMHSIIGLLINVLMNFALIPKFGIIGASISTLISLFFSSLLLYLMSSKTRKLVLIFFRSVLL